MNYKLVTKYILATLATLFVLGILAFALFFNALVSDITAFLSKSPTTKKAFNYPKNSVHGEIEINRENHCHVTVTIYDDKHQFIEDNVTLLLNGTKLSFSKVPNGYYGYWKYYYISSYKHPKLFEQSDTLIITLKKNNTTIDLATVKNPPTQQKTTIPFTKELNTAGR